MKPFLTRCLAALVGALALAGILLGVGHAQAPGPRAAVLSSNTQPTWSADLRAGLPPGATFTRASGRTCFDATGLMVTLGNNVPCIYVDPATGTPWGYLAEMQSTNAVINSRALTGTGWTATAVVVTDNAQVSPDGTTNAATIKEDGTTASHIHVYAAVGTVAGSTYGISFSAKNISGSRWLQFGFSGNSYANFNPSTGAVGSSAGASGVTLSGISARQLADGWWRFSLLLTAASTSGAGFSFGPVSASNSTFQPSFAGDNSSTIAVTGVQFETAGVGVTSYIATAGSAVTRSQDILTMPLTAIPGWSASKGGVLAATYRLHTVATNNNQPAFQIDDGTSNNRISLYPEGTSQKMEAVMVAGGATQFDVTGLGSVPTAFQRYKAALGWDVSKRQVALDGAILSSAAGAFTLPTITTLNIGRASSGGLNGTLESIAYYAGARPDSFVQQVSRPRRRRRDDRVARRRVRRAFVLRRAA